MAVDDLAQQDGAAVPQLRHEIAELVPGIGLGDGGGARQQLVSHRHFSGEGGGVDPQLPGQRLVHLDELRGLHGRGQHPGMHGARQPGIGIVEGDGGVSFGHARQYRAGRAELPPPGSDIKNSLCPHGQAPEALLQDRQFQHPEDRP